jgi:3-oxoadipate enol-lactonase
VAGADNMTPLTHSVSLGDHVVEVDEYVGNGSPIVLIHSAILDRDVWSPLIDELPAKHVISYDLRGHGSARSAPAMRSVRELASDLAMLCDAMGVESCHVVGVSLGGAVAQQFAVTNPERVRSLVVIASAIEFPSVTLKLRAQSLTADSRDAVINQTLERWFSPSALDAGEGFVEYARRCLEQVDEATWRSTWNALSDFRIGTSARRFRAPVLAIAGSADASTPPALLRAVATAYPAGSYVEIGGAPHLVPLEHPAALGRIIQNFISSFDAGSEMGRTRGPTALSGTTNA